MEKYRAYVIPVSKVGDGPNERPQTRVMKSAFGAQLSLGLNPHINEAFLVEAPKKDFPSKESFYDAVREATSGLGEHCTNNLMESIDKEGKWKVTRLIIDKKNPITYP